MTDKKRILFVDDDPSVLAGLKNLLYKDRTRWDMVFALGGACALAETRSAPFDVVVTDMRMPEIDGASLLSIVKAESPSTVRIILSGHANRELIERVLPSSHQLLRKPCEAATLRTILERSLADEDVANDVDVCQMIGSIDQLPTPPDIFFDLARLMLSPTTSTESLTSVVSRDPALSAKILQVVNSAYFGMGRSTTSIRDAITRLGTEQLRYLALTASVFSTALPKSELAPILEQLQRVATTTAALARVLAEPDDRDRAFASGLLHDIGKLVFAYCDAEGYAFCAARAQDGESPLTIEHELFGVNHADVGARLLAIWGLPLEIVDVVRFHHDPGSAPQSARALAALVHVADALASSTQIDLDSVTRAGCLERIDGWRTAASRSSSATTA